MNWITTPEELEVAKKEALASGKEEFNWLKFIPLYSHERGTCEML